MKIKLCGMFRDCDIDYANEAKPDYIGFILGFPKSHAGPGCPRDKSNEARHSPESALPSPPCGPSCGLWYQAAFRRVALP